MCTVLVADDEYLEREIIKKVVNDVKGARIVGEVNSGRKTMELYSALKPQLLFINCNMGGMSGFDAARKIRENNKDVIIIMTSAVNSKENLSKLNNLQINEFLLKPIKPVTIEEVVLKYLDHEKNQLEKKIALKSKKQLAYYPMEIMSKEIKEALAFIEKHYYENLSLEMVAGTVYLSSYYFSRLFKKEVGVNFLSYLVHKKINEAKRLLEETDNSILEISTYLNFKEQNYFCKVFKKNVGCTPTQYRIKMGKMKKERKNVVQKYMN